MNLLDCYILWILSMFKCRWITHKLNIQFIQFVSDLYLHIIKIHKNKIHSYNKNHETSGSWLESLCLLVILIRNATWKYKQELKQALDSQRLKSASTGCVA